MCDGVTMDWRLGITTLAAIFLFYWNRMARGGIWYDLKSCPPFHVLLIMIRSHFKRSSWPLGILPVSLCLMEIVLIITTIINAIAAVSITIRIKDFQRKTKTDGGTQQSIYRDCVHGDLGWICSSHRFIRYNIPNLDLFCSTRIIYLYGMFDRYKCTRP